MINEKDKKLIEDYVNLLNSIDKKKIYISGPVSIYHNDNYATEEFNKIEQKLIKDTNDKYVIVNPVKFNSVFESFSNMSWGDFMICDLTILNACDYIYMCDNWQISKGAMMEKDFAENNHITVINQFTINAKNI